MNIGITAAERGWLPDWVVRAGIRVLLRSRLRELGAVSDENISRRRSNHLALMRSGPIAPVPDTANTQHYEVPAEFFKHVLGPRFKYSCGWWPPGVSTLPEAEESMLRLTTERAEVADGMRVLDLGCGWGSWSLWVAETFPNVEVVAVSNSAGQRHHIERESKRRALTNVTVQTADMNTFQPDGTFDRIVSVEMFEHMRNYECLLSRISSWLRGDGKLFVHIFCHRRFAYLFEDASSGDWMARHFFTGGMMPSQDLLLTLRDDLEVEQQWCVNGREYQRTAEAWLENLDRQRSEVERLLEAQDIGVSGQIAAARWRLFFLACGELFGSNNGNEWFVSHYLLRPSTVVASAVSTAVTEVE